MANISESREQNKFICSAEAQAESRRQSPLQFNSHFIWKPSSLLFFLFSLLMKQGR